MRQGAFLAVLAADWHQTRVIATETVPNPACGPDGMCVRRDHVVYQHQENNPILGKHPSRGEVDAYFAGAAVLHTAIAAILPKEWRKAWQYIGIGVEGTVVTLNFRDGIW